MNQHVSSIHASKLRLAFDRRDAVGVYNTHVETSAGISQASRAPRVHVTEEIACTRPQTPHRKGRRTRIHARLMHKRREVRAAPEIWIVCSQGQEPKSPVQPRRTLRQRIGRRSSVCLPIGTWRIHAQDLGKWQVLPHVAQLRKVVVHALDRSTASAPLEKRRSEYRATLRRFNFVNKLRGFMSGQGEPFFGAREATIFSKRGSPRSASHSRSRRSSP